MSAASLQPLEVVQVLLELDARKRWTQHSLELLGDARTLAAGLDGAAGGWVLTTPGEPLPDAHALAVHGCRRLRQLTHPRFAQWSSEAMAVALADQLATETRVVLLPGNARGEEVAALLAGQLQTAWIPDAISLSASRGAVEIAAVLPGGKLSRSFRPCGQNPVVVTMRAGVAEIRPGGAQTLLRDEVPVNLDRVPELTTVRQFIAADPKTADLVFADRIVAAGRGTGGPDGVALVARLAEALGASLGSSRLAVDLGWVAPARQIGQTGRTVCPELYVACGISGASHHLQGMRDSRHIVAINPDASAPIHGVAHLSLHADLGAAIPAILAVLEKRMQTTAADPK